MDTLLRYFVQSLPLVGGFALLGMGITAIYQASRVLNLAHGAMAMGGAYAAYSLQRLGLPAVVDLLGGILFGALFGLFVERVFVRRLRPSGATTQTVGTVAVLSLSIALATRIYGSLPVANPLRVLPSGSLHVGDSFVPWNLVLIFPIGVAVAAALFGLFQFTDLGLAMRGAAMNRRGASLRGVDPDVTAAMAWALGGALAALYGILTAGATELDPFSISLGVLPAFVAALIGGLESMPGVCLGALIVGIVEGMVPVLGRLPGPAGGVFHVEGAAEMVLGVMALVVMALRGQRLSMSDVRGEAM